MGLESVAPFPEGNPKKALGLLHKVEPFATFGGARMLFQGSIHNEWQPVAPSVFESVQYV